jgi:hypothetical protein
MDGNGIQGGGLIIPSVPFFGSTHQDINRPGRGG